MKSAKVGSFLKINKMDQLSEAEKDSLTRDFSIKCQTFEELINNLAIEMMQTMLTEEK